MAKQPKLPVLPPRLPDSFLRIDMGRVLPTLDSIIRHRSTPMIHTTHIICPCITPTRQGGTGEAVPDCPECSGTGFAYPGNGDKIGGVVFGVRADDTHIEVGSVSMGQISVTFPTEVQVAEGDRLHLYRSLVPMRHLRKYKASMRGMSLPFDVQDVIKLVTNEPTTLRIIELVRGKDYTLDITKNFLTFPSDGLVKDNAVVSGVFLAAPYYIIQSLTSAFRGQITRAYSDEAEPEWVKMPQAVIATRSDILAGRFQRDVVARGDAEQGEGY